jgi:hypothetical protein
MFVSFKFEPAPDQLAPPATNLTRIGNATVSNTIPGNLDVNIANSTTVAGVNLA